MSTELVSEILNKNKDMAVIEKIMQEEISPEIENKRGEVILKVLEVVDKYDLDPWNIDLDKFTTIFLNEVNQYFRDFPVAGKIVYFAWINIRNKSELLLPQPEEPEELLEDSFDLGGEEIPVPDISLGYMPVEKRNVTIEDIVEAIKNTPLSFLTNTVRKARKIIFQETAHPEDFQVIIGEVWKRMLHEKKDHFTMESISKSASEDFINIFQSSLFLAYYGRIELNQEIPFGNIWIKMLRRDATSTPVPEVKLEEDDFAV
jgi:segregation and condensation protein A